MENNSSLFSLFVDAPTKEHLLEAAKWARFLAIVGFISLGLLVVLGIFASSTIMQMEDTLSRTDRFGVSGGMGIVTVVSYVLAALLWFFPLLFLFRFGQGLREAVLGNDQQKMTRSFQNLKICFRYLGILTVIGLVLALLGFLIGLAGLAVSS